MPVTGVISSNNVAWEFVDDEICLTCEGAYEEIENNDTCPECGGDLIEKPDGYIECEECLEEWDKQEALEMVECFDHEKLIGDWKKDEEGGLYVPDENGEFAAIVTSSTFNCVQVVWSKWTTNVRAMCSPCFPGQADLDSGEGNIMAYTLPDCLLANQEFIDVEKE